MSFPYLKWSIHTIFRCFELKNNSNNCSSIQFIDGYWQPINISYISLLSYLCEVYYEVGLVSIIFVPLLKTTNAFSPYKFIKKQHTESKFSTELYVTKFCSVFPTIIYVQGLNISIETSNLRHDITFLYF